MYSPKQWHTAVKQTKTKLGLYSIAVAGPGRFGTKKARTSCGHACPELNAHFLSYCQIHTHCQWQGGKRDNLTVPRPLQRNVKHCLSSQLLGADTECQCLVHTGRVTHPRSSVKDMQCLASIKVWATFSPTSDCEGNFMIDLCLSVCFAMFKQLFLYSRFSDTILEEYLECLSDDIKNK